MKAQATIPVKKSSQKPFIRNGRNESFVKPGKPVFRGGANIKRIQKEEKQAGEFAGMVVSNPAIVQGYIKAPRPLQKSEAGQPLSAVLLASLKELTGEDFTGVRLHADELSTKIARKFNAAAVTIGEHIYFNTDVYKPGEIEGLILLAHELFHTLDASGQVSGIEVQLKPLTEMHDRSPDQEKALKRAAQIAVGEQGKVNSGELNEDNTRKGWQFLVEYFRTTFGDDRIVQDKAELKPGKFLEDVIKFVMRGKAQKVRVNEKGEHVVETKDNVDLLPSWCGIFAFWALHKAGVHPPPWEVGKPNFGSADTYPKGKYLPRPGDIVIKSGYNHHALVVGTEPANVTDDQDLKNLKVITINGNTAGSNHTGGQIQLKTDPYNYWDHYVNPFFKGVEQTPESEYRIDERLKKNIGEKPEANENAAPGTETNTPADISVNNYNTSLEPATLGLATVAEGQAQAEAGPVEPAPIDPKAIMAADPDYAGLQESLNSNAAKQKKHEAADKKASEAIGSAESPGNERLSTAQAQKVTALGGLPAPPPFRAAELKANILKAVQEMLDERARNTPDGDKPKIQESDIAGVKEKNEKDIAGKKQESVGSIKEAHENKPTEDSVPERVPGDKIVEDAGTVSRIPDTSRAVAKPLADERITLEKESGNIDAKMAESEVDEQQLEESNEEKFTGALGEKRGSQAQAAAIKDDYRTIENNKLEKDKKIAQAAITSKVDKIYDVRATEFGNVNATKDATKTADELKRKEIADKIEKLYSETELSVKTKLDKLDKTVNDDFDNVMSTANKNFKKNVNEALDDEFTSEWFSKTFANDDYKRRVKKVFDNQSKKYQDELSEALTPLTNNIANTLNAIMDEIQAAKTAVAVFVNGLSPAEQQLAAESAKAVMDKFNTLQNSVNEKQDALTNGLAKKYADGVIGLEEEFKKIMDSRKSWLEKAMDAIVDAIKEIINLFIDLKKALERAAEYGRRIIKAPLKFFNNLVKGATEGFNAFVKNIGKHLLQGALEWITGEMGEAGIVLPDKFDFKGILSIILQILGLSVQNVKEIAKKVIGEKYVAMLEKGVDIGVKAADKILQIFAIIKKDGIAGLWEFIKEQFNDLKEKLMEEAKSFIVTTIVEVAVVKIVSMLIPGAGFISAVKSLIDFLRTLFAKARQIVNIITGIIDTFGEILAGNVGKVSAMVENVLAKFLGMAITFLAAILGLGKIGKKINDIIQKKIRDPLNKAITKMMEKLKALLTKLGVFKFLDKVDQKIKSGKQWVEDKKEKVKEKAKEGWDKLKAFVKNLVSPYTDKSGEKHTLKIEDEGGKMQVIRRSMATSLGGYLGKLESENEDKTTDKAEKDKYRLLIKSAKAKNSELAAILKKEFNQKNGVAIRDLLSGIAELLKQLPSNIGNNAKAIPTVAVHYGSTQTNKYSMVNKDNTVSKNLSSSDGQSVEVPLLSINSPNHTGSEPADSGSSRFWLLMNEGKLFFKNRVRGHILNHQLFGTGADVKNLGPIPKSANNKMKKDFETPAKNSVHAGRVVSFKVSYDYDVPNDSGGKIAKFFPGLTLPVAVRYDVRHLQLIDKKDASNQAEVDKPSKWEPDESVSRLKNTIPIAHDTFF